jgi:SHS2 domain-containing protein
MADSNLSRQGGPERGYRLLPHTADVIISAWAPTDTACVDEAVRALIAVFAEVPDIAPRQPVPFTCEPASNGELLVRVLEEVIYLLEVRDLVAVQAVMERTAAGSLAGYLNAVPVAAVNLVGPAPKAITRHGLFFGPEGDRWGCAVTVDV